MTLREAYDWAVAGRPVFSRGILYKRILRVGYYFAENGTNRPFADLADMNTGSVTVASLSDVLPAVKEETKHEMQDP